MFKQTSPLHLAVVVLSRLALLLVTAAHADTSLLNVSYDPTRELYQEFNAAFAKHWHAKAGEKVSVKNLMAVPAARRAR